MAIRALFYKVRLSLLMYGFAWLIWFTRMLNRDFRLRLAETPFAVLMTARGDGPFRYYECVNGHFRSSRVPMAEHFSLIWRDSRTGGQVMQDMLLGKPRALYNAVVDGVLQLEGDGKMIAWFLQTINQINRIFRSGKHRTRKDRKDTIVKTEF